MHATLQSMLAWSTQARHAEPFRVNPRAAQAVALSLFVLLAGCAGHPFGAASLGHVEPLQIDGQLFTLEDAEATLDAPDLLALNDDMRSFVATYSGERASERGRLVNLHQAVKSPGILDMRYDAFAEGSAQQVFAQGSANCLSYAHMFVALAREAGLDARYQWLEVRPQWTRMGDRVAVRLHVNVLVKTRRGDRYMVAIDPLESQDIAGSRTLRDEDAVALYHNNLAMDALSNDEVSTAWLHLVKALQLSPAMGQLWVNLGATYRRSGQFEAAERAYFRALSHSGGDRSAMNNLVILYDQMGRESERSYWVDRVDRYRQANPYYHSWLGDTAAESGDWVSARGHYDEALERLPGDAQLLYGAGLIRYELGDLASASDYIEQAMKAATYLTDVQGYRIQLEAVQREMEAAATVNE